MIDKKWRCKCNMEWSYFDSECSRCGQKKTDWDSKFKKVIDGHGGERDG